MSKPPPHVEPADRDATDEQEHSATELDGGRRTGTEQAQENEERELPG